MPITIYAGKIGSGKTVSLIRDLYPLRKTMILANLKLNKEIFKNVKPLTLEDIKNYKNWDYNNMTVVLDEIHTILDSRRSGTNINLLLSYWFLQSRKRNVNILGTTQFIHQLEKRVRDNLDYLINCECYKTRNTKSQYLDDNDIPSDFWIKLKLFDNTKQKFTRTEMYFANQYFHLYDTFEIIDFNTDNSKSKFLKFKGYKVYDKENVLLGMIKYYPKWKKHVYFPLNNTFYDEICNNEIGRRCLELNKRRKDK